MSSSIGSIRSIRSNEKQCKSYAKREFQFFQMNRADCQVALVALVASEAMKCTAKAEQMQELHRNGDKEALGELDDEISAS